MSDFREQMFPLASALPTDPDTGKATIMSEHTPTTENIRNCYVYAYENYDGSFAVPAPVANAEFDRWLAAYVEQVRADERERCAQIATTMSVRAFNEPDKARWADGEAMRMDARMAAGYYAEVIAKAIRRVPAEQKESKTND